VACIYGNSSYRVVVGNLEGKRQLEWENNIKTDLKETGCQHIDCIYLEQVGENAGFCEHGNCIYVHFLNKLTTAVGVCEHILLLHSKHSRFI
jgi:hypothetical protein